jgi:tRNA-guanine family transglycosylase
LEEKGFIKRVDENTYCLTVKGYAITQLDPQCPTLFLAGADRALRVAVESGARPLNWLLSAGRYWGGGRFVYSSDFKLTRSLGGMLFLDSGAQQFYSRFNGSYPYTTRQYLDFALTVGADLIATLDIPLDIVVPRGLSVWEGVRRTVELGVEVIDLAESVGALDRVVPVLQGYSDPSQWLECLDLYRQHGVMPQKFKLWSIGSLCMAKSSKLVEEVVTAVRRALGGEVRIHVFGISMDSLRRVYNLIDSYDTSAWVYWAKMDGAVLVWSSRKKAFIHLQARDGRRYDTEDLMEVNLKNVLEMHMNLCQWRTVYFYALSVSY